MTDDFSVVVAKNLAIQVRRKGTLSAARIVIRQMKLALVALPRVLQAGHFGHFALDFDPVGRRNEQNAIPASVVRSTKSSR